MKASECKALKLRRPGVAPPHEALQAPPPSSPLLISLPVTPPVVRKCYYHDNSLLAVTLSSNQKTLMNHQDTEDDALSVSLALSVCLTLSLSPSLCVSLSS